MACTALKRPVDFEHIHSPLQRSPKRRRCMPMVISNGSTQTKSTQPQPNPSHFGEVRPKYTPELIQDRLQAEVRRMRKRRQVIYDANRRGLLQSSSPPPSDSDSEMPSVGSPQPSTSSHSAMTTSGTQCRKELKEQPLFTLKQVGMMCERLVVEREGQIREEYDDILVNKLAEQYDAFVRFSHDQIQRRFADCHPSYVS